MNKKNGVTQYSNTLPDLDKSSEYLNNNKIYCFNKTIQIIVDISDYIFIKLTRPILIFKVISVWNYFGLYKILHKSKKSHNKKNCKMQFTI